MRKLILIVISLLTANGLSGQINKYGTPIIKNYSIQTTQASEYNWSIVKDKTGVVYFANDYKGIIRYDGNQWSMIQLRNEALARTLGIDSLGVVYVGGSFEFGYLEPSSNGHMNYVSISQRYDEPDPAIKGDSLAPGNADKTSTGTDSSGVEKVKQGKVNIGQIVSMVVTDSVVYFASYESLFIYHKEKDSVEYINLRDHKLTQVVKFVVIGKRIFMAGNSTGLYELKNRKPELVPGGDFFKGKICMVILPYDETRIYIGTYSDGVFLFDLSSGKITKDFLSDDINEMLKNATIYTALDLPTGERILGTLNEGVFVFSREGELLSLWNKETTEMQDNTVTALYAGGDKNSELWISTAGFISTAFINAPFTEFTPRLGYEGVVNNITKFGNSIFVSTDLGLFKSKTTDKGLLGFEKFRNISNTVFVLFNALNGKDESLLVGSNLGLYQILKNGSMLLVDSELKFAKDAKPNSFAVRSVIQSKINPERFYVGQSSAGLAVLEHSNSEWRYIRKVKSIIRGDVTGMFEDDKGDLLIYCGNPVGIYRLTLNDTTITQFTPADGLPNTTYFSMSKIGKDVVVSTSHGLFKYLYDKKIWTPGNELTGGYTNNLKCLSVSLDQDNDIWLSSSEDRVYDILLKNENDRFVPFKGSLNILPNLDKMDFRFFDGKYWIAKSKNIYAIDKQKMLYSKPTVLPLLTKIVIGNDSLLLNGSFYRTIADGKRVPSLTQNDSDVPEIKYNFNSISFFWTLPFFVNEETTQYSYRLDGFSKEWSKWELVYYKDFTNLPYGKYTFRVKAKTATEIESGEVVYEFYILKPWYLTTLMIVLYGFIMVLIIFAIIKAYTRKLKNENIRLEGIVTERTAVVVKQKEELESSIHYASRIQMALLPSEAILQENLKNYFILFKPRDIVSGDFYWMMKKNERLYVVAADCTGHGVPGAFMSLLGMSFLDEIIDKESAPRADYVLSELRLHVTESLKQVGGDDEAKDGMDMSLLVVDFNSSRIEFSGAYNPCFKVRKLTEEEISNYHGETMELADGTMSDGKYLLETIFASKMPIGISSRMNENFVFYDWNLEKGISYYLFSDGYIDQFGGPDGRKFMKKNFKRFILEIQDYPMKKQKDLLEQNLKEWMGQSPQIDDILVMGIRTE